MNFTLQILALVAVILLPEFTIFAQTNVPALPATAIQTNTAMVPMPRNDSWTNRQMLVLQRTRENPGDYDIVFIGDSITQAWEDGGRSVWQKYYGSRKCLNLGVAGDRTQHVLWRLEQGQLKGIKAKIAVVMIGTNNSNHQDNTEADILVGVTAIVQQIRLRQPDTKIILLGIFPRGKTFSLQRGKILQVNQALSRLDDGKNVFFLDLGAQFIDRNGAISQSIMPDALHLSEAGYEIWAAAIEPKLKELLAK